LRKLGSGCMPVSCMRDSQWCAASCIYVVLEHSVWANVWYVLHYRGSWQPPSLHLAGRACANLQQASAPQPMDGQCGGQGSPCEGDFNSSGMTYQMIHCVLYCFDVRQSIANIVPTAVTVPVQKLLGLYAYDSCRLCCRVPLRSAGTVIMGL
jgi:hypothetical protein